MTLKLFWVYIYIYIYIYMKVYIWNYENESEVAQSCLTLCDPIDCSLPGSSVHGIFQAIVLEWIAISFSSGSSQPRAQTRVSCIVDRCFTVWAMVCESIYTYIKVVQFHYFECSCTVFLRPFMRVFFPHCIFLPPLLQINWPYKCRVISGLFILFHWSMYVFLSQYHTILITVILNEGVWYFQVYSSFSRLFWLFGDFYVSI